MPRLENLPQTRISFRRSANNLHIATGEDLDLEQARAILNLMRCHSSDCNKFFIDVRHVTRIQPAAAPSYPPTFHRAGRRPPRGCGSARVRPCGGQIPSAAAHPWRCGCPGCGSASRRRAARLFSSL